MTTDTAKVISSGVGPLIAALIGAYQLWLKGKVDENRDVPFDRDRLGVLKTTVERIRLQLVLFAILVAAVTAIPLIAIVGELVNLDFGRPIDVAKVLVAFVALVGVINVIFLVAKLRQLQTELSGISRRITAAK